MKITWRVISREEKQGKRGEKVQGIRSINGRYKIDRGDVKNSIGVAIELYKHDPWT